MKRRIISLMLVVFMMIGLSATAFAAGKDSKIEEIPLKIKMIKATDSKGNEVAIEESNKEVENGIAVRVGSYNTATDVEEVPYAVIKLTPTSLAKTANANLDRTGNADPEKATVTGLTYGDNAVLMALTEAVETLGTPAAFISAHGAEAMTAAKEVFGSEDGMNEYTIVMVVDIHANAAAKELLGADGKIELAVEVKGMNDQGLVILQHDASPADGRVTVTENNEIKAGSVDFIKAETSYDQAVFTIGTGSLSPFVMYSYYFVPSAHMQSAVELKNAEAKNANGESVVVSMTNELDPNKLNIVTTSFKDGYQSKNIDSLDAPVVKITSVGDAAAANVEADAHSLGTAGATPTATGVTLSVNKALVSLYEMIVDAGNPYTLLQAHKPDVMEEAKEAFHGGEHEMADYGAVSVFDIRANRAAMKALGEDGTLTLTINVPGVTADSEVVVQHDSPDGNSLQIRNVRGGIGHEVVCSKVEFMDVVPGDGTITMTVSVGDLANFIVYVNGGETVSVPEAEAPAAEESTAAPAAYVEENTGSTESNAWVVPAAIAVVVAAIGGGAVTFGKKRQ